MTPAPPYPRCPLHPHLHEPVQDAAPPSSDVIVGEYELSGGATNYWHYVNVAKIGEKTYRWTNAAGVSWTLTFTESFNEGNDLTFMYDVGKDCPYYEDGYETATLSMQTANGIELDGPSNEKYIQIPYVSNIIIGEYELTSGGSNKWHYVNISKQSPDTNDIFTWANSAGSYLISPDM